MTACPDLEVEGTVYAILLCAVDRSKPVGHSRSAPIPPRVLPVLARKECFSQGGPPELNLLERTDLSLRLS